MALSSLIAISFPTLLDKCLMFLAKSLNSNSANLLSPNSFGYDFVIGNMYDSEMNPIESTPHAGMEFYLEIESAKSGDIIRGA